MRAPSPDEADEAEAVTPPPTPSCGEIALGSYPEVAPTFLAADSSDGRARTEALRARLAELVAARDVRDLEVCVAAIDIIRWDGAAGATVWLRVAAADGELRVPVSFFVERTARGPTRAGGAGTQPADWRAPALAQSIARETSYAAFGRWLASDARIRWVATAARSHGEPRATVIAWQDGAGGRICALAGVHRACFAVDDVTLDGPAEIDTHQAALRLALGASVFDLETGRAAPAPPRRGEVSGPWAPLEAAALPDSVRGWEALDIRAPADGLVGVDGAFECARTERGWACDHRTPSGRLEDTRAVRALPLASGLLGLVYVSRNWESGLDSQHESETFVVMHAIEGITLRAIATLPLGEWTLFSRDIGWYEPLRSSVESGWGFVASVEGGCVRLRRAATRSAVPVSRHHRWRAPRFYAVPDTLGLDARRELQELRGRSSAGAPELEGLWRVDPVRGFERVATAEACAG